MSVESGGLEGGTELLTDETVVANSLGLDHSFNVVLVMLAHMQSKVAKYCPQLDTAILSTSLLWGTTFLSLVR